MTDLSALQNIFSSNFYIDAQYGQSFGPFLHQFLAGKTAHTPISESQLIQNYHSKLSIDESGAEKHVVVLTIKQPIIKYTSWSYLGSKTYQWMLSQLEADPSVLGVVLDIDSGGGQSYGTAELYDSIQQFRKPIVTYTDGLLCSAAYYIAAASDYIVANKRAEAVGSIGAYSSFVNFSGIIEKFGGQVHEFYATESTEKNSEYREVMKGNYEPYIKNVLDPLVTTFQNDMKTARPQLDEKVFKGGTWNGTNSLELGLIDEIGPLKTAVKKVIELSADENNLNNLNKTDMSKKGTTLVVLASVLGVESVDAKKANIFSAEETISLNLDQLQKIEDALSANKADESLQTTISALQNELKESKATAVAESEKVTELNNAVETAIENAGLTAEKKNSTSENIAFLAEKVVEYGANDGGKPTTVHSTGDKVETEGDSTSFFDSLIS